ncbi:hypothetical protein YC2023_109308 [Brassica napus]
MSTSGLVNPVINVIRCDEAFAVTIFRRRPVTSSGVGGVSLLYSSFLFALLASFYDPDDMRMILERG